MQFLFPTCELQLWLRSAKPELSHVDLSNLPPYTTAIDKFARLFRLSVPETVFDFRTLLLCNKSCGRPSKFVMVRSRCCSYFYPLSIGKLFQLPIRLLYLIKFLLLHVLPTIPSECFKRQRLNRIEWAGNVKAVCVRNLEWWISTSNMSHDAEITVRPLPTARVALFCGSPRYSTQDLNLIRIPAMSLETNISCLNVHRRCGKGCRNPSIRFMCH